MIDLTFEEIQNAKAHRRTQEPVIRVDAD